MMPNVVADLPAPPPEFAWERIVWTAGLSEVRAALALEESGFVTPEGAMLGFLPGPGGVRIKLASRVGVAAEAMDRAEAHVRQALAGFAISVAPLERAVLHELGARGRTLATAESCTGGLLGARITDVPGSSSVYLGGVVAYANRVKTAQLGVDPAAIEAHGAVSEPVARAMAEGARRAFSADVGVAVTGVAGPGGGTPVNPVGSVWFGLADAAGTLARHFLFSGSREMIRERSVAKALELVWRRTVGESA
jgi:nicotinamide-nucleotide amidase